MAVDPHATAAEARQVRALADRPPKRAGPVLRDETMVLGSCVAYLLGITYALLCWRYDMSLRTFLAGELFQFWQIPFVFAPNRSVFAQRTEGSRHQALLSSLLSIAASAGGAAGPLWLGASVGAPDTCGAQKCGPVAPDMLWGNAGLVLFTFLVYAAAARRG